MRAIWGAGEDDDTDNESDGMVMVRTMTIMRIGASWGSEEGEWGERSKRQKQLMLEAKSCSHPLFLHSFIAKQVCEESVEACRGRNCALAGREYTTAFVGQPFMYIVCKVVQGRCTCSRTLK